MARAAASSSPASGFAAVLRLAATSVDYGGPRPSLLTPKFLRALIATEVLAAEDHALAQRLLGPKQRQADRQRSRTTHPLMTFACVNCEADAADAPWLYCSPLCVEMAKTIRYGRSVIADGRIGDPEVKEALRIAMASVTGGGYPREERRLAPERRQQILDRDEGLCQSCGGPGNEIDHIGGPIDGDINHPDNLQVLCADCHRKKTMAGHRIATDPEHIARAMQMHRRIHAPEAERACDDPATWSEMQRQLSRDRRDKFCRNLERLANTAGPALNA